MSRTLDLRGLKCPLPALLARRAMLGSAPGEIVEIVCDDPLCGLDIPHMCREEEIEVVEQKRDGALVHLWLRRMGQGLDVAEDILSL